MFRYVTSLKTLNSKVNLWCKQSESVSDLLEATIERSITVTIYIFSSFTLSISILLLLFAFCLPLWYFFLSEVLKRFLRLRVTEKFFLFSSFLALFLDRLAKVIFNFFSDCSFKRVWHQDRSYWYDMPFASKPCSLEINSNRGLKREHLESSSSTSKNIIFNTTMPMATKFGRALTYLERL